MPHSVGCVGDGLHSQNHLTNTKQNSRLQENTKVNTTLKNQRMQNTATIMLPELQIWPLAGTKRQEF